MSTEDQGFGIKLLEAGGASSGPASTAIATSQDLAQVFSPDADYFFLPGATHDDLRLRYLCRPHFPFIATAAMKPVAT